MVVCLATYDPYPPSGGYVLLKRGGFQRTLSESTLFELNRNYPGGNIEKKFDDLKKLNKIKIERITEKHLLDAKKLAYKRKVPVHDAVHALICKEQKAVMVTRDAHFFEKLSDIVVRVARAEELLLL